MPASIVADGGVPLIERKAGAYFVKHPSPRDGDRVSKRGPRNMKAMVLRAIGQPLVFEERAEPRPGPGEIRLRVEACAVCRTDLHVVDGDLPNPRLPIIPGHEIVGIVDALGAGVEAP